MGYPGVESEYGPQGTLERGAVGGTQVNLETSTVRTRMSRDPSSLCEGKDRSIPDVSGVETTQGSHES